MDAVLSYENSRPIATGWLLTAVAAVLTPILISYASIIPAIYGHFLSVGFWRLTFAISHLSCIICLWIALSRLSAPLRRTATIIGGVLLAIALLSTLHYQTDWPAVAFVECASLAMWTCALLALRRPHVRAASGRGTGGINGALITMIAAIAAGVLLNSIYEFRLRQYEPPVDIEDASARLEAYRQYAESWRAILWTKSATEAVAVLAGLFGVAALIRSPGFYVEPAATARAEFRVAEKP